VADTADYSGLHIFLRVLSLKHLLSHFSFLLEPVLRLAIFFSFSMTSLRRLTVFQFLSPFLFLLLKMNSEMYNSSHSSDWAK